MNKNKLIIVLISLLVITTAAFVAWKKNYLSFLTNKPESAHSIVTAKLTDFRTISPNVYMITVQGELISDSGKPLGNKIIQFQVNSQTSLVKTTADFTKLQQVGDSTKPTLQTSTGTTKDLKITLSINKITSPQNLLTDSNITASEINYANTIFRKSTH